MLPHIDAENGHALGDGVLVLGRDDAETCRVVLDQPTPAAAGDAQQRSVKRMLELVQAAPDAGDLGDQAGCGVRRSIRARGGRKVLPEEGVVDVASAVEVECRQNGDAALERVGVVCFDSLVQVCDVGLVVLAVVKLHDLGRDVRFQCLREGLAGVPGAEAGAIRTS